MVSHGLPGECDTIGYFKKALAPECLQRKHVTVRTQTALRPLCHVMLRLRGLCLVVICVERAALGGSHLFLCQHICGCQEAWGVRGQGGPPGLPGFRVRSAC